MDSLNLSLDAWFPPRTLVRGAIEVYPHPALVALFNLATTLKYKAKKGRTPTSRNRAFKELVGYLENLKTANPALDVTATERWAHLRRQASNRSASAALDRAEDEIDAYVCAYVALYYWTYGQERCRVVGDLDNGYIVTPVNQEQAACLDELTGGPTAAARRGVGASPG